MPLEQNILAAGPPDYQPITATIAYQVLFELFALVGFERRDQTRKLTIDHNFVR